MGYGFGRSLRPNMDTPDKIVNWARERTGAAAGLRPLPMGAGMGWRVFTGEEVEDMSLTILGARHTLQNVW